MLSFVPTEHVNPLSGKAIIRPFKNSRNALLDAYSGRLVSEVSQ